MECLLPSTPHYWWTFPKILGKMINGMKPNSLKRDTFASDFTHSQDHCFPHTVIYELRFLSECFRVSCYLKYWVVLTNWSFITSWETSSYQEFKKQHLKIAEILLSKLSYHTTMFVEEQNFDEQLVRITSVLKTAKTTPWDLKSTGSRNIKILVIPCQTLTPC